MVRLRLATWRDILHYLSEMIHLQRKSVPHIPVYCCCALLGMLLSPPSSADEPAAPPPPQVVVEQPGFFDFLLDTPRAYVSDKLVNFVAEVDSFFGSNTHYQESNKSVIQYDITRTLDRTGVINNAPAFRAKLHLPNVQDHLKQLQKSLHVLLESNPDQNPNQNFASGTAPVRKTSLFQELSTPDSYGAALRLENTDDSPWRFSADSGLKLDNISVRPFARTRASFTTQQGEVLLKLAESVFWFNTTGVGETTQFDADYHVSEPLLLRSTSAATWLHDMQNFDLRQDISLYHSLDESRSLLYQLSAIGVSRPQAQVSEYAAVLLYRQRVHRDWVFMEVSPQLRYPRSLDYQLNSMLVVRLELLFSK